MLPFVMGNSTDLRGASDLALQGAAYLVAYICVTIALAVCFVILLSLLSLILELLCQSVQAVWFNRQPKRAEAAPI